jgi:hypothetical protein
VRETAIGAGPRRIAAVSAAARDRCEARFFLPADTAGRIGHHGSDLGVFTSLYFDAERKHAVIILMNRTFDLQTEAAMAEISTRLWTLATH